MKRILAIFLVLFLMGCAGPAYKQTIETDEGKVTIEGTAGSDEWCQAGANWQWTGSAPEGDSTATWKIEELMTSGKYDGLCHVVYMADTPDGKTTVNYYFSEDGETGYMEMEINGQTFTQEWSK